MTNPTLDYYNKYAVEFSKDTFDVKFTETQDLFLSLLKPDSYILDFGCGPDISYNRDIGLKL